ncbi:MAG: molybdopterin-guanine dinucleotide biosynthesis protein B [Pirellulaceae bacterium]
MNRLHIVGRKNHGKTTLVVDLVTYLKEQGYCVGTIKHTHHQHRLDTPGKDSYRHREAGADVVGIVSPGTHAAFWTPVTDSPESSYEALGPLFADCDMVLVEGDSHASAPRMEVWRSEVGSPPMAAEDEQIEAIVADDELQLPIPQLNRSDIGQVAAWILKRLDVASRRSS